MSDPLFDNPFLRDRYLEQLRSGQGLASAARALDVHPSTVKKYRDAHPDFEEQVQGALQEAEDQVLQVIHEEAVKGRSTQAAQLWLKYRSTTGPKADRVEVTAKQALDPGPEALAELERRMEERRLALEAGDD